jgi:hypothetical protein
MKLGASIFNATYETFPDLHAQLRVNRKTVVERCIVASVGSERVATDQGLALTPDISLRLLTDDVPATGATNAARAKARQYGRHEGNLSGMQPYAIMANRLPYAASALANGPRDVTVAMSKAASQLNLYVSRKLKEATQ